MVLYENPNFGGNIRTRYGDTKHLGHLGFNNVASSAKVFGPCDWIFYAEPNYLGDPTIVATGDYVSSRRWGHGDNVLSSLRCIAPKGTVAITIFEHHDFAGKSRVLDKSVPDFAIDSLDFHDVASSAIVTGGTWILYEHPNYQGENATCSAGDVIGLSIGDDVLSAVKLIS